MGFWSTVWTTVGKDFLKKGLTGAFGGDQPTRGSPQIDFPSYAHLKVGIDRPSEAGEAGEIETADAIDILQWNQRLFSPPYQKTEIVIPRITDRLG